MNKLKFTGVAWLCLMLAACGGGSGGSEAESSTPLPEQVPDSTTPVAPVVPGPVASDPQIVPDKAPGGGQEPGSAPEPAPSPDASPASTPEPTPDPIPAPRAGADIDLTQPFSQSLNCYYGPKPYYEVPVNWQASYDGDKLTLQALSGNTTMGGSFSQSGNPIERESYGASALRRTYIGASGGEIWFARDLNGFVISTGHNQFGGYDTVGTVVECGEVAAPQWVAAPASTPFKFDLGDQRVGWNDGSVPVSCKLETGSSSTMVADGSLVTAASGAISLDLAGRPVMTFMTINSTTRVFQYQRYSGGSVFWETGVAGEADLQRLNLDGKARLLRIVDVDAGASKTTTCVPRGLTP